MTKIKLEIIRKVVPGDVVDVERDPFKFADIVLIAEVKVIFQGIVTKIDQDHRETTTGC